MAERGSRAERRRRERSQGTREPRGHQRWPKWIVATGTALLLTVSIVGGGVVYHQIDQNTPYTITEVEGIPLIQKALQEEGVAFNPQEKDLWDKAELEKQKLPTDTLATTVDSRLDLLRKTMYASKNDFFTSTAQYLDDLLAKGVLYPRILTNPQDSTVAAVGADIIDGKLILDLNVSVTGIRDLPLWESAFFLVHERKHMEQFLAWDSQNQTLSNIQKESALAALKSTREKALEIETPAYAEQIKAFLRYSALTGLNPNNRSMLPLTAQFLKADQDHTHPKFSAYLVERRLIH